MFLTLMRFDHCLFAELADEAETHVGNRRGTVKASFLLHLINDVAEHIKLVFIKVQSIFNERVTFDKFARRKPYGNISPLAVIFDKMHYAVDRPVKQLVGFQRVPLKAGEAKDITIVTPLEKLKYYDPVTRTWVLEKMEYPIFVGNSEALEDQKVVKVTL